MSGISSIFEQKTQRQQTIVDTLRRMDRRTTKPSVHSTQGQDDFLVYFTDVLTDHTEPASILRLTETELESTSAYFSTQTGEADKGITKKLAAGRVALDNAKLYAQEDCDRQKKRRYSNFSIEKM